VRRRRGLRLRWCHVAALALLALALTLWAWGPMLAAYPHTMNGDGQQYHKILEAGRASILRYHEFPHWNPYECGGYPLWDNPQSFAGAPLTWLTFVVGTTRTIQIWIVAHVVFAFLGMWLLARHDLALDRGAALVAGGAWAYCGFHQHHLSGGHLTFAPFAFFPAAVWLWRRAERDRLSALGLGALLAWMFYEGGVYPLPQLAVLLAAETLLRSWPPRRLPAIAMAGAIVGVVAFTLSAARLLPVLDQLAHHRRSMAPDVDALRWPTLRDMFLAGSHDRAVDGQQYVWTEYGAYLGPIVMGLALVGFATVASEQVWLVVLLVVTVVLMMGHFASWAPWSLLTRHVAPFTEMRVPSRFRASVCMLLAALAGVAVHRTSRALSRRGGSGLLSLWMRVAPVAVGLLGVADVIGVGRRVIAPFFAMPPESAVQESPRLYYGGADLAPFIDQPRQNRGELSCWDEWGFGPGARMWEGDTPQARALDPSVLVRGVTRTQNSFTIDVDAARPGRILLDGTFDDDWHTDVGTAVNVDRQLAIDVPAVGATTIHVRCRPRTFDAGCALTGAGIVGTIAYVARRRRRRRTPSSARAAAARAARRAAGRDHLH